MAFPSLSNMINGYSCARITPIGQEPPSFHYYDRKRKIDLGSDRPPPHPPPPTVPSTDHPRTISVTPAAASSLPPPQSHRQPPPPSTKVVLKATWLYCEDCVQKTKKMFASVAGIQHLRIDTEEQVIEVEGSIDAQWLRSYLAKNFQRKVEILTQEDQNGDIHDHNRKRKDKKESRSVGDTKETDKKQDNLGGINGDQQKVSDNVKAESDLQQPPTLANVNLPSSINKNPEPEAKNSSSTRSAPTQPLNPDLYKVPAMRGVVLKTQLHCEGCITKLKKTVSKIKGVEHVKINVKEELIEVQGTMDTKELPADIMKKLNRKVEVVILQPQPSSVNRIKSDKGDQQMSKPKRRASKTDDREREHTSREHDRVSNIIKDERGTDGEKGVVFNKERKLNHSHDHATRNVMKDPKGDELADKKGSDVGDKSKKGSDAGDKSDMKRGGYMEKQKEEAPQVSVTAEETKKGYHHSMEFPPIYCHNPAGNVQPPSLDLFSDENANACSVM